MASSTPPPPAAPPTADSLRIEVPASPLVVPLLETAVRIFSGALPGGGKVAARVRRGLVAAFLEATAAGHGPLLVELGRDGTDLTVSLARPGAAAVVLRFSAE